METRKKTQTPRMDRKALILTVVGALLVIAIIVIAVVLMQRSNVSSYEQHYADAMEHYVAGEYSEAISSAQLAYSENPTEEAVLIIARSYAGLGDYSSAISALEAWVNANGSGSEASSLLEQYRELTGQQTDGETVTIAGEEYALDTETLTIANKALSGSDLQAVASLTKLTSLSLNGCSLTDISALSALTGLTSLSLEDNEIESVEALAGLTNLTALYLSGNSRLGSLEPLYGLNRLRTLDLRGREITDGELEELQNELPGCTILTDDPTADVTEITLGGVTFTSDVTELNLSGLGITDISALSACTQLESLDISYNNVTDISVLASMPELKTLDFSSNQVSNISPLLALTKLETLWFADNNVSNIAALSGHTAITELVMDGNPIGSFSVLSTLTGLKVLSVQSCGLTDSSLEAFKSMTWLDNLSIQNNSGLTRSGVDALVAALPNTQVSVPDELYSVTIGGQSFDAASAQVDASGLGVVNLDGIENFTSLVTLILSDNPGIDLSNIGAVPTLQNLELARCELTNVSALSSAAGLTTLNLMQNNITDLSPLRYLTNLTELHLSLNEDLSDISALAYLKNLTYLSLNGTAVTNLSALSGLTALETLDLEGCSVSDVTPLYSLKSLRTLYAAGCGLTQQQINALGVQLPNCTIYT